MIAGSPFFVLLLLFSVWTRFVSEKWMNEIALTIIAIAVLLEVFAILFVMPYYQDRLRESGYQLCERHAELSKTNPVRGWKDQAWVLNPNDCRKK